MGGGGLLAICDWTWRVKRAQPSNEILRNFWVQWIIPFSLKCQEYKKPGKLLISQGSTDVKFKRGEKKLNQAFLTHDTYFIGSTTKVQILFSAVIFSWLRGFHSPLSGSTTKKHICGRLCHPLIGKPQKNIFLKAVLWRGGGVKGSPLRRRKNYIYFLFFTI